MRPTWLVRNMPTPETMSALLELVGVRIDSRILEQLSPMEGLVVSDWAIREHLRASDNVLWHRPKPYILELLDRNLSYQRRVKSLR